jgi:F-type H+-transporting ATPase subunit a
VTKALSNPKIFLPLFAIGVLLVLGLIGGKLGSSFPVLRDIPGAGFLGGPIAHIQLPGEQLWPNPNSDTEPYTLGVSGKMGKVALTNTVLASWVTTLLLVGFILLVKSRLREVPGRLQGLVEVIIESAITVMEGVAGPEKTRRFFPLVMTVFIFVMISNWMGILPGYGSIGLIESAETVIHHNHDSDLSAVELQVFDGDGALGVIPVGTGSKSMTAEEFHDHHGAEDGKTAGVLVPFLRSANTDINVPLSMALVVMVMVQVWGIRSLGVLSYFSRFINVKRIMRGQVGGLLDMFVGALELLSEFAKVISFTFRLFGNVFAGEVLLIVMTFLIPLLGVVPFYGLELFVGFIQAFIFAMLTLVFATMATVGHGEEDHG